MGDLVLETDRLVLRQIDESDAALHDRALNTPAVMGHLGGVIELHEIEAKHAKSMASFAREGFGFMMMIEKAGGEFCGGDLVGHCGIKRVDNRHAPNPGDHEIGWIIREDRWRRGYAFEAMTAVIEWGFTSLDAPRLVALTSRANTGSWMLMKKLGMTRREDLDFSDPSMPARDNPTIQYALEKEQWENQK
ncbi:GNAT family N-acetyltransferase [Erythrobacter insulae]|uniref:GNAT family N-acetyltransferase n=1 Tax=Erythrobacter insulae TaxID=2584124 RepID=A0A547PB68_9SPHN|nr:GNAT family N-acetyltransferase [Erythrobacter insulae]